MGDNVKLNTPVSSHRLSNTVWAGQHTLTHARRRPGALCDLRVINNKYNETWHSFVCLRIEHESNTFLIQYYTNVGHSIHLPHQNVFDGNRKFSFVTIQHSFAHSYCVSLSFEIKVYHSMVTMGCACACVCVCAEARYRVVLLCVRDAFLNSSKTINHPHENIWLRAGWLSTTTIWIQ